MYKYAQLGDKLVKTDMQKYEETGNIAVIGGAGVVNNLPRQGVGVVRGGETECTTRLPWLREV